jgi:hypothetical protein
LEIAHLGGIVALVGMIGAAVGTVAGSKVAVKLLQRAHERFEDAVWKAIDADREKAQKLAERVTKIEAICEERAREGVCT